MIPDFTNEFRMALIMADMIIGLRTEGDYDDFLIRGFDDRLRHAIRDLVHPDPEVQEFGAATTRQLWTEVPHLHVRLK